LTDLDAILRAVVADPADDTPRLVYAEVCDDAGEHERAEFIREQCELARMPADEPFVRVAEAVLAERLPRMSRLERNESRDILLPQCFPEARQRVADRDAKRKKLRRRERELFDRHKCEWFGGDRWAVLLLPDDDADLIPDLTGAVVRRGFVDEIRTGLSQFVGDRCPVCDIGPGVRRYPTQGGDWTEGACDHCHGTGRVGLDLAAVFAVHPIARVVLADREPTAASHQSGAWHWTWAENDADSRVGLPRKLMAALSASGIARVFDSRDAAMDGLSLACVNLGRAAAGLDPLT